LFRPTDKHAILKVLAAAVHVGMQAGELTSVADFKAGVHAIVRMAGRNLERAIGGGESEDALARRLFGEDDAEPRLIAHGVAVRCVVHLKNNV